MKKSSLLLLLLAALLGLCSAARAQFMDIRVSIKVIRDSAGNDPVNASPPSGGYGDETINLISNANIQAQIAFSNTVFANGGRGLRFVLSEPIQHIQPAAPGGQPANYWYDIDARSSTTRDLIETAAIGNTAVWRWRTNAINYYINNTSSGVCSFPGESRSAIIGGSVSYRAFFIHECGHFFNLRHTHDTQGATSGGDDGVADTLLDRDNWSRDQIAMTAYGANCAGLNGGQQWTVDNTWFNVMSYHVGTGNPTDRLTSDQLDILCDNARSTRAAVCATLPHFVDWRNSGFLLFQSGASHLGFGGAYGSWSQGYSSAPNTHTLLIRPGTYNTGAAALTKPMTLRATRSDVRLDP